MATTPFPFVALSVLPSASLNNITTLPVKNKTVSYTLVAADAGSRVVMNSASATTITVNTGLFDASNVVEIINIGAGTCTVTAGTATVTTSSSLALSQWGGGTLYFTSTGAAIFFSQVAVSYGTATGGTGVVSGPAGYNYTSFTSDGTLTVTRAGLFDLLFISGAGSGGGGHTGAATRGGGGGAGGGMLDTTVFLAAGSHSITIGAGGTGAADGLSNRGAATRIGVLAYSTGGGAGQSGRTISTGYSGASTGGGCEPSQQVSPTATLYGTGYGNIGGNGVNANAGGGGGSKAAAGSAGSGGTGGAGAAGTDVAYFIGGSALFKAGGGGGGGQTAGGAGGSGGATAGVTSGNATSAAANTGSGAGGTRDTGTPGAGGSGIAYVRWKV